MPRGASCLKRHLGLTSVPQLSRAALCTEWGDDGVTPHLGQICSAWEGAKMHHGQPGLGLSLMVSPCSLSPTSSRVPQGQPSGRAQTAPASPPVTPAFKILSSELKLFTGPPVFIRHLKEELTEAGAVNGQTSWGCIMGGQSLEKTKAVMRTWESVIQKGVAETTVEDLALYFSH